jgi:hypothetical protein
VRPNGVKHKRPGINDICDVVIRRRFFYSDHMNHLSKQGTVDALHLSWFAFGELGD